MPDYIKIRTARNVEIEYRIASLGDRIIGRVIDTVIIFGYIFFISLIAGMSGTPVLGTILIVPVFFYSFLFERFNNGQTPGKNIMMTRVVSLSGDHVTTGMYLMRWMLLIVDVSLASGIVGIISILGTEYGQRLGDLAAGTTVISLKKKTSLRATSYHRIPKNYIPKYEEATLLNDTDIQTIKKVMRSKSENKSKLIAMTVDRLEEKLGIIRGSSAFTTLKDLILDYNYYQRQAHQREDHNYTDDADTSDSGSSIL